ncbi:hypothetical protein IU501_13920 [Nocardia otitidiscaviarum]|uniref:hypothetical protein n=1 Tax=Nocardia otitidiscaviarum TaxID=1823 RepID=UPI000ACE735B|nr:hypothetical protein [Nocardia otitidiscaviarum]MBF6134088.1 hypothetical protein [Nocardia otitidiscaviarum]MBF6484250.1 hypothetical protein [Nocardia otitidiscaviarum]
MDILAIVLIVAGVLAALTTHQHRPPRHRYGRPVAELQARLAAESARTYLPLRGW